MGDTHFVKRNKRLPLGRFRLAVEDCRKVVEAQREEHERKHHRADDPRSPYFGEDRVQFNLELDPANETFLIERLYTPVPDLPEPSYRENWFKFHRTDDTTHDVAVCSCLIVFGHHCGKSFLVSSSGDDADENWAAARDLCQRTLGFGADFTAKVPPPMTVHGLTFTSGWMKIPGGFIRDFSNGWELCKYAKAKFKYTVFADHSGEVDPDPSLTGNNSILGARWRATVAHFKCEFFTAPFFEEFQNAMLATPGEWTPFLAWTDKLQDHGHEALASKIRAHIPR